MSGNAAVTLPLRDFPQGRGAGAAPVGYDTAYGGEGGDHSFSMVAAERYGRMHTAGVGMALGVQAMMATPSLHKYGTHEVKQRFLAPAIAGTAVAISV